MLGDVGILAILSSVAPGLLIRINHAQKIGQFIQSECQKLKHSPEKSLRLEQIKKNVEKVVESNVSHLVVDSDKTLLLAHAFGGLYTPALALATSSSIVMQLYGYSGEEGVEALAKRYLFEEPGSNSIFIRVAVKPKQVSGSESVDANPFLQIRSMLSQVGYDIDLGNFQVSKPANSAGHSSDPISGIQVYDSIPQVGLFDEEFVCVDLHYWYCSCEEYFEQASMPGRQNVEERLQKNEIFHDLPTNLPNQDLPLCPHILAVLLVMYNWEVVSSSGLVQYQVINGDTHEE